MIVPGRTRTLAHRPPLVIAALTFALAAAARAEEPKVDFARQVQPIFAARCLACHGPDKAEGGLRLTNRQAALAELDSGSSAIVPGQVDRSELLRRVSSTDPDERMPPEGEPLTAAQVGLLRQWIAQGAPWQTHWAFRPVVRPALPAVTDTAWPRQPLDRFVLARLEAEGIRPSPEADRATLLKRLSYDLVGLPPAPEEVDAFLADASPEAYERQVERLLASPRFGERWGRHWLDVARYADSDGYEKDGPRPDAWHWRDWVIRSLNADQPFDQFTIQQLAGDLLPGATFEQRLATAFHRQTLTNLEGGADPEQFRHEALFDRTETTAAVWLGLTLGCARCHSHKYEQISQREYYRLFALFNAADETTLDLPQPAGAAKKAVKLRVLGQPRGSLRPTRLLHRGDFLQPTEPVEPGGPAILPPLVARQGGVVDRLDLARWLLSPQQPLTPRVAANQLWQALFGRGLVTTPDDFGVRGEPPSHPELLDYLASEYRDGGWSRKRMIRLLVTSASYRQSSRHRPELAERDPRNALLHRQNRFRVEGEIVRDVTLAVAGLLSAKIGGPSVFPPMPPEIAALSYAGNFKWTVSQAEDRYRRGMYTFFKRTAPDPNLTTFDCPDANLTRLRREVSNTPLQALAALNNEVFVEAARGLARRLLARPGDDAARLAFGFRLCTARPPSADEQSRLSRLLAESRAWYAARPEDARNLAGGAPPGVAVEEAAAWMATVRVLLNLDELLTRE